MKSKFLLLNRFADHVNGANGFNPADDIALKTALPLQFLLPGKVWKNTWPLQEVHSHISVLQMAV